MTSQEYSQFLADLFERQQFVLLSLITIIKILIIKYSHSGPPPADKNEILKLPQIIFTEEDSQCFIVIIFINF